VLPSVTALLRSRILASFAELPGLGTLVVAAACEIPAGGSRHLRDGFTALNRALVSMNLSSINALS
jgi:hypothetical protein